MFTVQAVFLLVLLLPLAAFAEPTAASLVEKYECGRCHELPDSFPQYDNRHSCFSCHQTVLQGGVDDRFSRQELKRWKERLTSFTHTPTLNFAKKRLRRDWIEEFLLHPYSIRPRLASSMPRLQVTKAEAELLAAAFSQQDVEEEAEPNGDTRKGEELLREKGCLNCHLINTGEYLTYNDDVNRAASAGQRMAPDLGHVKERMYRSTVVQWLQAPQKFVPESLMPDHGLRTDEAQDIAAYLFSLPLHNHIVNPTGLPSITPLARKVTFKEVNARLLDKLCRHCHYSADKLYGRGGPGNTGGFGYRGVGLDLSSESGVRAGLIDRKSGKRVSILLSDTEKLPRVVEVLLARHSEASGEAVDGIIGMPLGLPPVPLADIRLLYTWVLQVEGQKSP